VLFNDGAGTTVASSMMDKSGRRTLLMGSYAGMVRNFASTSVVILQE
jgi:hypothetical protein